MGYNNAIEALYYVMSHLELGLFIPSKYSYNKIGITLIYLKHSCIMYPL